MDVRYSTLDISVIRLQIAKMPRFLFVLIQTGNIVAAPFTHIQVFLNTIIIIQIKLFSMILLNKKGLDPDQLRAVFVTLSVIHFFFTSPPTAS